MPKHPDPQTLDTAGDYSPGIVMGNYTVNGALTPAPVALADAFKIRLELRPSERGFFVDLEDGRKAFVNGCNFDLLIGNAGSSDAVLRSFHLSVEVEDLMRPVFRDKKRRYGTVFTPHQLFIDLYRDGAPGWWLLSDGRKHGDPRKFIDARRDLLESEGSSRLLFRLSPGELELIEGALTPRDDGLFKLRFVFGIVTATEKICRDTDEFFIVKGEVGHGD